MTARPAAPLSPAEMRLAALLADTDLTPPVIAAKFGAHVSTMHRIQARVYAVYGVHSRAGLRAAMLALELAPVGAR